MSFLNRTKINDRVSSYEGLCDKPSQYVNVNLSLVDMSLSGALDVSHERSHIAVGNKGFTVCNRSNIRYDDEWTKQPLVRFAYLLWKARQLNKTLTTTS